MDNGQEAKSRSRNDIRQQAKKFRKMLGIENAKYVDVLHILDVDLPRLIPDFDYEIVEEKDMSCHGLTYPDDKKIYIREDVYNRASNGIGRDRLTILHEIYHYFYHTSQDIVNYSNSFARGDRYIPAYKNTEWQANAFAGEVLMDSDIISDMLVSDIVKDCGVSYSAARLQKSKCNR